jgi:signal transduction histidine kinase
VRMAGSKTAEIRIWLHALREPLSTLSLKIELLESGGLLTTNGQAEIKSMRASMERATAVFEDLDFLLENGHARPGSDPKRTGR